MRRDQPRDVAAGGLMLHWNRDGEAVVLNQEDDRKFFEARRVDGLPEFTLAGGAFAGAGERDGVRRRIQMAIALGAPDGGQQLRSGRGRRRHDMQLGRAPVRRHLAAARRRIGSRARRLQEHILGRHAQRQAQGAVAIVREEPVVAGAQREPRGDLYRFMPGATDLEKDLILPLQQDLPVVDAPGGVHQTESMYELFGFQAGGEDAKTRFRGRAHRKNTLNSVAAERRRPGIRILRVKIVDLRTGTGPAISRVKHVLSPMSFILEAWTKT